MATKSDIKIGIKDVVWNYAGSILSLGMNLIILPIILRILPSNDLGMWYVFSSIAGLITLIDFGFSPSISRCVTCCWCGADELKKEGLAEITENSTPNYSLLKSLARASKLIYLLMAIISGIILLSVGSIYIYKISLNSGSNNSYYFYAWIIYIAAIITNLYFSYWPAFLKGIGAIKELNIATIISRVIYIVIAAIGLLIGGGLIAISLSLLVSGIILRLLSKRYFDIMVGKDYELSSYDKCNYPKKIFTQILPSSSRYGIVSIGVFLSTRAITLLCSYYLGLNATASYGLSMQLIDFMGSFSQLLFHSYSPLIVSSRIGNDKKRVLSLLSITVSFQLIVGFLGITGLIFFNRLLLNLIGSNAVLLSRNMLLVLGGVLLFEWNSSIFVNFIMTSNSIPFAKSSIISGVLITLTTFILLRFTNMGLWSLIIGKAVIGFMYNYWYWPRFVCKDLNVTIIYLLRYGYQSLLKKAIKIIKIAPKKAI